MRRRTCASRIDLRMRTRCDAIVRRRTLSFCEVCKRTAFYCFLRDGVSSQAQKVIPP